MNKSEQLQVQRAAAVADSMPEYAASTLATLHRAANSKTQGEIVLLVKMLGLSGWVSMVNGCMVPGPTARQVAGADSMLGSLS